MATRGTLHLSFEAAAESVGAARAAAADFARELGFSEPMLGDVKTIVSEAAGNAVRHAYLDDYGTFELEAFRDDRELAIVVRDFGRGIRTEVEEEPASLRLGLGLISTLARRFEISSGEEGTEVRVRLAMPLQARGSLQASR